MADRTYLTVEPQTEAEDEAAFAHIMAEVGRLNQLMRNDDIEIALLKSATQRLKEEAERFKAETAQLKAAGKELDAEISATLKRIKGAMSC